MKYFVLIFVQCILFSSITIAQEKFVEGKLTVDGKGFEVSFSKSFDIIIIESSLPLFKDGYPMPKGSKPPLPIRKSDMRVDTLIDRKIIFEVLGNKINALRANNDKISIEYVFERDGKLLDIASYSVPKNTLITPGELALIDKRLRKAVRASFKGPDYLHYPSIMIGREIRF